MKNIFQIRYYALFITLLMFLALVLINTYWVNENIWRTQLINLIMAIQSAAIITAFWEFFAKKIFSDEIIQTVNISNKLVTSGVQSIEETFQDLDWKNLLENTKSLKVAVAYGSSWRQQYRTQLSKLAKSSQLTVYLPDYNNKDVMESLSFRFCIEKELIANKIIDSAQTFKSLGANVFLYGGTFTSSYYLLDNCVVMSVYNHQKVQGTVPVIVADKSGTLYKFITDEFKAIEEQSIIYKEDSNEK